MMSDDVWIEPDDDVSYSTAYQPGLPVHRITESERLALCEGSLAECGRLVAALTERAEKAEAARDHYRSESTHFQREYDDACAQFDALTEQTETAEAALTDAQAWIDRIEREYRFASSQVAAVRALTADPAPMLGDGSIRIRYVRIRAALESTKETE